MVRQTQRLGPLKMGVTGNHRALVAIRLNQQSPLKSLQVVIDLIKPAPQPQAQVRAHLIIAAAACVELFPNGPHQGDQPPLHSEVNILISEAWIETTLSCLQANGFQTIHQLNSLLLCNHPTARQHPGMGNGAIQVLLKQRQIKSDGRIERLDEGMKALFETITPCACSATGHTTRHGLPCQSPQLVRRLMDGDTLGKLTASGTLRTTIDASSSRW